jgi:hypothetical protein
MQTAMQTAMETAFETSIQLATAGEITSEQLQEQMQTAMQTAMETAFETSIQLATAGEITSEQLQEQMQTAMQTAMETAFETSIQLATAGEITSEQMKEQLAKIQASLEEQFNSRVSGRLNAKVLIKHALISSTVVSRSVEGQPKYDSKGNILLENDSGATFKFKPRTAAALGYTPRENVKQKSDIEKAIDKHLAKTRSFMAKNARLPGGRAIDGFINTKVGGAVFKLIDMFDNISDILSVVCTFTDGFFYDPDRTNLSWEPWKPDTFRYAARQMINAQLDVIKEYNQSISTTSDEYPYSLTQYPIIVGPLEKTPIPDRYHGDTEYVQKKIGTEIDVVLEKILRSPGRFHDILRTKAFNGDEEEMKQVYTDPEFPDDKLIYYLSWLSCQEYDDLYRIAFTDVCTTATYAGNIITRTAGVVYEDEYKDALECVGGYKRKRFQCGYKTFAECEDNAREYMASNGQLGTYGEWWSMSDMLRPCNDPGITMCDTRVAGSPPVPLITATTFGAQTHGGACIVTGQGMRSLCKQATLTDEHYNFANHSCDFTEELCQSFGTCVATDSTGQTYCKIPKAVQGFQQFFGQQAPREFIRINGCHIGGVVTDENSDAENFNNVINFTANNGSRFFNDMAGNKANWNKGMQEMFIGGNAIDTWMNLGTIIVPMMLGYLGVSTGPLMILIFIAVGAQMADAAAKQNRAVAQTQPNDAAEYTIGGWKTNQVYSTIFSLEAMTFTSATTTYTHDIKQGDKVRFLNLKWTNGTTTLTIQSLDVTVTSVPTPTSIGFGSLPLSLSGFVNFIDQKGYVKLINPTVMYTPNPQTGRSKVPQGVGYVDGWLTKPLRPRNSNGQIVPVTDGVDKIAGCVRRPFFIDVQSNNKAYQDGQTCSPTLVAIKNREDRIRRVKISLSAWDFNDVTDRLRQSSAEINARFMELRNQAQARLDELNGKKRALQKACTGIGLLDGTCATLVAQYVGGNIAAAFSEIDEQISEVGNAIARIDADLNQAIRLTFTVLGNELKGYFTEVYDIMKTDFLTADWTGRCVDTRIRQNFDIGKALGELVSGKLLYEVTREALEAMNCPGDIINKILEIEYWGVTIGTAGLNESYCIMNGKINPDVNTFSDECYLSVAVESATGTITAPGSAMMNQHIDWDNWMDAYEYKRLCYELPTPMIRAWSASLSNNVWCIPSQPPDSWADPAIGMLEPLETQYAVNRAWTNFGDGPDYFSFDYPQYPDGVLYQEISQTRLRDSAKHWWYQLVYSKDDFNRENLWNDDLLQQHFTHETISWMRSEYCMDDLLGNEDRGIEAIEPALINDKCWGYLSVAIPGYTYMPMTILSKVTQAI